MADFTIGKKRADKRDFQNFINTAEAGLIQNANDVIATNNATTIGDFRAILLRMLAREEKIIKALKFAAEHIGDDG